MELKKLSSSTNETMFKVFNFYIPLVCFLVLCAFFPLVNYGHKIGAVTNEAYSFAQSGWPHILTGILLSFSFVLIAYQIARRFAKIEIDDFNKIVFIDKKPYRENQIESTAELILFGKKIMFVKVDGKYKTWAPKSFNALGVDSLLPFSYRVHKKEGSISFMNPA